MGKTSNKFSKSSFMGSVRNFHDDASTDSINGLYKARVIQRHVLGAAMKR